MAVPQNVSHINFLGSLANSGEVFAWGFWMQESENPGGWDQDAWQGRVDQIRDAVQSTTLDTSLQSIISPNSSYHSVKGYLYTDGNDSADFSAESIFAGAPLVGTGTGKLPPQCSLVLSLRASGAGASYRSRAYLPATGMVLSSAGQADNTICDTVLASFKSFLIELSPDTVIFPVVYSRKLSAVNTVNTMLIDTVVDTQRRRAQQLTPAHIAQAAAPPN